MARLETRSGEDISEFGMLAHTSQGNFEMGSTLSHNMYLYFIWTLYHTLRLCLCTDVEFSTVISGQLSNFWIWEHFGLQIFRLDMFNLYSRMAII